MTEWFFYIGLLIFVLAMLNTISLMVIANIMRHKYKKEINVDDLYRQSLIFFGEKSIIGIMYKKEYFYSYLFSLIIFNAFFAYAFIFAAIFVVSVVLGKLS